MTLSKSTFEQMQARAAGLAQAYQHHGWTGQAHTAAAARWQTDKTEAAAKALMMTEDQHDKARDAVISEVSLLASTVGRWLACVPLHDLTPLRTHLAVVQAGIQMEGVAFLAYANASGGSKTLRAAWQTNRTAIMEAGQPLMALILETSLSGESTEITALDASPAPHAKGA